MNNNKRIFVGSVASIAMLMLILDTKSAIQGATEGVELCLYTVIPSLFPFIILSALINGAFIGMRPCVLVPLGRLCGIPAGVESLFIPSFLGGYPVGAEAVRQAYDSGQLKKEDAMRMLGFCNNAGPAFIFGMTSHLFTSPLIPWLIWGIQILSAILTGIILPGKVHDSAALPAAKPLGIGQTLARSIRVTGIICGWVVLFRIIIVFCKRWFLWLLAPTPQNIFAGLLELVNGCVGLSDISSEGLRFILCCGYLSFGGLCVAMQTATITKELGCKAYIKGKCIQCAISIICAAGIQYIAFSKDGYIHIPVIFYGSSILFVLILIYRISLKKSIAFHGKVLYNSRKT